MPAFQYRAADRRGLTVRGQAEAESVRDLAGELRAQGLFLLRAESTNDWRDSLRHWLPAFPRRVKSMDLVIVARQFATMVDAGLPIVAVLRILAEQVSHGGLRRALEAVAGHVGAGESLASAFITQEEVFPPIFAHMVWAGEAGGMLDQSLLRLADQLEKEEQLRQQVRSALAYPTVVAMLAVALVVFMLTYLLPQFVGLYSDLGGQLPFITRALLGVSHALTRGWWAVLGAGVLVGIAVRAYITSDAGRLRWHNLMLRLPLFGSLITKHAVARFARPMGSLLDSGMNVVQALTVVEAITTNRVVAAAIRGALEEVRRGKNLVIPLRAAGLFPSMVIEMVSVGEATGQVGKMFGKLADFYETDVQRSAERLSSLIEPLLIVGLAGVVGVIVLAMMLPIFDLWTMF